jgi:hypothetical protein
MGSSPAIKRSTAPRLQPGFTAFDGSLSDAHAEKIGKVMDPAMRVAAHLIALRARGKRSRGVE